MISTGSTVVTVLFWSLLLATCATSVCALVLSSRRFAAWKVANRLRDCEVQLVELLNHVDTLNTQHKKALAKYTMRERRKKESSGQNGSVPDANKNPEAWRKWASTPPHLRKS